MDLDMEADTPYWFDPDADLDFNLLYDPKCSADQKTAIVDISTENLEVDVDFGWFTNLLSHLLYCDLFECVERVEEYIAGKVKRAFDPISRKLTQSLPAGALCQSAERVVHADASVDLVFHVTAPPPPTPVPTPVPTPTPTPSPSPTPPPPDDPPPSPCFKGATPAARRVCP